MSWHCSLVLVEEFSDRSCLDGEQCALLRSSRIAEKSFFDDKKKRSLKHFPSGTTSEHSTAKSGVAGWMSSLPVSHVNHSQSQGNNLENMTNVTFGPKPSEPFVRYDQGSAYWKTPQGCLDLDLGNTLGQFLEDWPHAGTMRSGVCWELVMLRPPIKETDCGFLFSTPVAMDASPRKLSPKAKKYKTRSGTIRAKNQDGTTSNLGLSHQVGGRLNPRWIEWLMGWPIGWTGLHPLGMDKFQQWLEQHGICSRE